MKPGSKNSFKSLSKISINNEEYKYYSLKEAEKNGLDGISKLPKSIKVLLENLLRYEDDLTVNKIQILQLKNGLKIKNLKQKLPTDQREYYYKIIQEYLLLQISLQ